MRKSAILITGCAGFIGSNLVKYFLNQKKIIIGVDNLKLGKFKNIKNLLNCRNFSFKKLDVSNLKDLDTFFNRTLKKYSDTIWHLAANSDIKEVLKIQTMILKIHF